MANSLQDQLLKAGLTSKTQVSKANKAKHKKAKQRRAQNEPDKETLLAQQERQQERQQKNARDRDLNRGIVVKQQRQAAIAELKQLLDSHAVENTGGEVTFNFQHNRKIKQLSVSKRAHAELVAGRTAIVHFDGRYRLIPSELLEKVRQRSADLFIYRATPDTSSTPDDEYAGHQVPDDLMW